jgi:hypothetical protein
VAAVELSAATSHLTALDQQLLKLIEKAEPADDAGRRPAAPPRTPVDELRDLRQDVVARLPQLARRHAAAQSAVDAGEALQAEVQAFLAECVTAVGAELPPLLRAARAEAVACPPDGGEPYLLCVRLLAGGLDRTIEERQLRTDRWTTLSGVSAEYCCVTPSGEVVASGVRHVIEAATCELSDPSTFRRSPVDYRPYSRREREGSAAR